MNDPTIARATITEALPPQGAPMVRVRLDLAYRGTSFSGWAIQPGLRTVQGSLEVGLSRVLRLPPVRLSVAGRTDSGVHARGQVAHVDVPLAAWLDAPGRSDRSPGESVVTRLNGVLPNDIVVHRASLAPDGFDARFSALLRSYTYRIADEHALRDPLRSDWTLWVKKRLDVAAMQAAVAPLLGLRDFAAFCKPRPGATTVRELQQLTWERLPDGPDAGLVVAHVRADAFCHNMVRALVGGSISVGHGQRSVPWLAELLASKQRDAAGGVVPPHGLTLDSVEYPPDDELAARAIAIRTRRMDEDVDG